MSTSRILVERDVETPMRDGTILRATVYRPDMERPLPVLLQRTPYGKDGSSVDFSVLSADRGYAVVVQDTRGRWSSDGTHYPMRDEFDDGYDTVEWAARQPWANGRVGMWGASYVGWTQWAAAVTQPPSLVAIFPAVTMMDQYLDVWHPGGALGLGVTVSWGLSAGASMAIQRMNLPDQERRELMEELADALDGLTTGRTFRRSPPTRIPLLSRTDISQAFQDMVNHPDKDIYWKEMDIRPRAGRIAVPAYHLGGWYDIFCGATLRNYAEMREWAETAEARDGQKLIMGPWLHGPLNDNVGSVDFGARASDAFVMSYEIMWRWFDHWLKGEANGIMEEPPVRVFVMGKNRWREEQEWPLARAVVTRCYLHSGGKANTRLGDGALSFESPGAEPRDTFTYDPADPVPTNGGGLCCSQAALAAGAFDQRDLETRPDVLVYTSAPFTEDLEVTGPLEMTLWAASSAVDTDFTAKLVDVAPCGFARNLADGIIRARYRQGFECSRPIVPDEALEYRVDLGGTSNVFLKGHCLRVEISSSNFPRFDRNPNTGLTPVSEQNAQTALQTIYHDADHPSHVTLPIIPS